MRHWKTTVLGIAEAALIELSAEALFNITWKQRAAVLALALVRATFGVLAADARAEKAKNVDQA